MAAKNSVKCYSEDGYYHIYNRGVAKNEIFITEQDYGFSPLSQRLSLASQANLP